MKLQDELRDDRRRTPFEPWARKTMRQAAAQLDLYEAALRELEKKATATLAAMDRYNDENSTYIIGPSLLQLGSAVAVARKALNSTDTGA